MEKWWHQKGQGYSVCPIDLRMKKQVKKTRRKKPEVKHDQKWVANSLQKLMEIWEKEQPRECVLVGALEESWGVGELSLKISARQVPIYPKSPYPVLPSHRSFLEPAQTSSCLVLLSNLPLPLPWNSSDSAKHISALLAWSISPKSYFLTTTEHVSLIRSYLFIY